jgi:hypothetical protein
LQLVEAAVTAIIVRVELGMVAQVEEQMEQMTTKLVELLLLILALVVAEQEIITHLHQDLQV